MAAAANQGSTLSPARSARRARVTPPSRHRPIVTSCSDRRSEAPPSSGPRAAPATASSTASGTRRRTRPTRPGTRDGSARPRFPACTSRAAPSSRPGTGSQLIDEALPTPPATVPIASSMLVSEIKAKPRASARSPDMRVRSARSSATTEPARAARPVPVSRPARTASSLTSSQCGRDRETTKTATAPAVAATVPSVSLKGLARMTTSSLMRLLALV